MILLLIASVVVWVIGFVWTNWVTDRYSPLVIDYIMLTLRVIGLLGVIAVNVIQML